jgi:hypothetical protein
MGIAGGGADRRWATLYQSRTVVLLFDRGTPVYHVYHHTYEAHWLGHTIVSSLIHGLIYGAIFHIMRGMSLGEVLLVAVLGVALVAGVWGWWRSRDGGES